MFPIKMKTADGEIVSVYQISVLDKEYDLGDYRIVAVVWNGLYWDAVEMSELTPIEE